MRNDSLIVAFLDKLQKKPERCFNSASNLLPHYRANCET